MPDRKNPADSGPRNAQQGQDQRGSSMSQGDRDAPNKPIQGGTTPGQTSGTQLGERGSDAMNPAERGGMASTDGRTDTEGGVGSAERSKNQERSRGGQMGAGGDEKR